jgi:hypothetical protein
VSAQAQSASAYADRPPEEPRADPVPADGDPAREEPPQPARKGWWQRRLSGG